MERWRRGCHVATGSLRNICTNVPQFGFIPEAKARRITTGPSCSHAAISCVPFPASASPAFPPSPTASANPSCSFGSRDIGFLRRNGRRTSAQDRRHRRRSRLRPVDVAGTHPDDCRTYQCARRGYHRHARRLCRWPAPCNAIYSGRRMGGRPRRARRRRSGCTPSSAITIIGKTERCSVTARE